MIEVLPTQLIPDEDEGKVLRVRLVMKEGVKYFSPVYLFDEGSTLTWIPCGRKLTCSYPGIKFSYGPDTYFSHEVIVSSFSKLKVILISVYDQIIVSTNSHFNALVDVNVVCKILSLKNEKPLVQNVSFSVKRDFNDLGVRKN